MVTPTAIQPTLPAADGSPSRGYDRITSLTPRGTAAARLSEFQDVWAELTAEDRAWFAWWLSDLLIDACVPELSEA